MLNCMVIGNMLRQYSESVRTSLQPTVLVIRSRGGEVGMS
jgi:hypothetical protein